MGRGGKEEGGVGRGKGNFPLASVGSRAGGNNRKRVRELTPVHALHI